MTEDYQKLIMIYNHNKSQIRNLNYQQHVDLIKKYSAEDMSHALKIMAIRGIKL